MERNTATLKRMVEDDLGHELSSGLVPVDGLTATELKDLYTKQLARLGSFSRPYYDQILGGARHGLCSYCGYGQADTLDHFIPKSGVPELSIDPFNLVPCCSRCNHQLLASFSTEAEEQMLHPYVQIDLGRWLHADLQSSGVLRFYAEPDKALPVGLRRRVENQFRSLKLAMLYTVVSAPELSGLARTLEERFTGQPAEAVSAHLHDISVDAFAAGANDRRGVMYEALAASSWYCSGGYLDVVA